MNRSIGYWLRNKLYVNVTNRTTSIATPLSLRGPSFIMPKESGFHPLPDGYEPSVDEMVKVIDEAYEQGKINVDSMKSEEVTFAGLGEPLLRLDDLAETARMIKSMRHGVPLRIKTNGLILSKESATVSVFHCLGHC